MATPQRYAKRARIRWLRHDEGGRRNLPGLTTYRSVIRSDDDPNRVHGNWDVEVAFIDPPAHDRPALADIAFMSPDAPSELLGAGSGFELTEGAKIVARGRVLETDDARDCSSRV